jgi:hypothetical protein
MPEATTLLQLPYIQSLEPLDVKAPHSVLEALSEE